MIKNIILLSVLVAVLFSCKTKEHTIVKIGDSSVDTKEFKYIYEKNHAKDHDRYSKESLDTYLNLFVNYRLKVLEAESLKLDSTPIFQTELNGYKKQLAKPYFTDNLLTEKLALEAYKRSKTAIKARHILIKVDETASPEDTAYAYKRISAIKDTILKGANFGNIAYKLSQDPSAQSPAGSNGHQGDLGYFSALRMVYAFENAAFDTKEGEISKIIRTKFGYHILQVQDIITMDYQAKVAHIMIKAANGLTKEDAALRKEQALSLYMKLQTGADWNKTCQENTEHNNSKKQNGELSAFTIGGSLGLPAFELAAYRLQNIGDISQPVKTAYGWHIIRLLEKVPFPSFDNIKDEYVAKIKRDARSQQNKGALIKRLKTENSFKESSENNSILRELTNNELVSHKWNIEKFTNLLEKPLFSIGKTNFKVYDFGQYIESNQRKVKVGSKEYMMKTLYSNFVYQSLISYEEAQLPTKHFDYKMLVQEFHDGILIYDLMKTNIWDKANKDTSGLRSFFEANKYNYSAPDQIIGDIYTVKDIQKMPYIKRDLERGYSSDSILKKYNTNSTTLVTVVKGAFKRDGSPVVKAAQWNTKHRVEMYEVEGIDYIIVKNNIRLNDSYKLKEIKGRVVADYQKELEKNFIAGLKSKYPVEVDKKEYKKLIKY